MLRQHGVVGKFVEFYGAGVASVPLANRATIGNMSPEFGSTAAMFPIDDVTLEYLRLTGRDEHAVDLVEAYAKEQSLWHDPSRELVFSEYMELDLSTVVPSIAGPKRPQDRILLSEAKTQFQKDILNYAEAADEDSVELEGTFPASDPGVAPGQDHEHISAGGVSHQHEDTDASTALFSGTTHPASKPVRVTTPDGEVYMLDNGAVTL